MISLLQISALVGAALPVLISLVKAEHWSAAVKSIVALALSAGAAALTCYVTGKLHGLDAARSFAVIYSIAQTSYLALYKPTGADGWLAQIGLTFTPPKPPASPTQPPA